MRRALLVFNYLARPLLLLAGCLLYLLGVGIARYLGLVSSWQVFWLGLGWLMSLQLSSHLFYALFSMAPKTEETLQLPKNLLNKTRDQDSNLRNISRRTILFAGYASLAVTASLTVSLMTQHVIEPDVVILMGLGFLGSLFYSAPPLRLAASGYGELLFSLLLAFLVPALGYMLQTGEIHRLLAMSTFPLVILCLAMLIAFQLSVYPGALKRGEKNFTSQMGWRYAMTIHNLLVLSAFLLIGLAYSLGLPRFVWLATMIALPVGIFQVYQMWRISQGSRPVWLALTLNSIVTFIGMAYLLTYAYWTH